MRRTRVRDFNKIEKAKDLESLVNDKRVDKRATKKKAIREPPLEMISIPEILKTKGYYSLLA